jgi:hypothetical protein
MLMKGGREESWEIGGILIILPKIRLGTEKNLGL